MLFHGLIELYWAILSLTICHYDTSDAFGVTHGRVVQDLIQFLDDREFHLREEVIEVKHHGLAMGDSVEGVADVGDRTEVKIL